VHLEKDGEATVGDTCSKLLEDVKCWHTSGKSKFAPLQGDTDPHFDVDFVMARMGGLLTKPNALAETVGKVYSLTNLCQQSLIASAAFRQSLAAKPVPSDASLKELDDKVGLWSALEAQTTKYLKNHEQDTITKEILDCVSEKIKVSIQKDLEEAKQLIVGNTSSQLEAAIAALAPIAKGGEDGKSWTANCKKMDDWTTVYNHSLKTLMTATAVGSTSTDFDTAFSNARKASFEVDSIVCYLALVF